MGERSEGSGIIREGSVLIWGCRRFVDDAFGFALTWNYWFNDAVSMASDLVALQLVLQYWNSKLPGWGLGLIFWVLLIGANIVTVAIYGEVGQVIYCGRSQLMSLARILA